MGNRFKQMIYSAVNQISNSGLLAKSPTLTENTARSVDTKRTLELCWKFHYFAKNNCITSFEYKHMPCESLFWFLKYGGTVWKYSDETKKNSQWNLIGTTFKLGLD